MWLFTMMTMLLAGFAPGSRGDRYVLRPESRMSIRGSSTVNRFTCESAELGGMGWLTDTGAPQLTLDVPARSFDCGDGRMNRDMYRALKVDAHPTIHFTLRAVQPIDRVVAGRQKMQVTGELTIAGVTRPVELTVDGQRLDDGTLRAAGEAPLKMSDFGIRPPSAMMGLIRAHDDIQVRFDLVAAPESAEKPVNQAPSRAAVEPR